MESNISKHIKVPSSTTKLAKYFKTMAEINASKQSRPLMLQQYEYLPAQHLFQLGATIEKFNAANLSSRAQQRIPQKDLKQPSPEICKSCLLVYEATMEKLISFTIIIFQRRVVGQSSRLVLSGIFIFYYARFMLLL